MRHGLRFLMLFLSILFGLFAVVLFGIAYQYLSYISKTPWMVDLVVHSVTNNNVTAFFCYVIVLFEFHAYFFISLYRFICLASSEKYT